MKAKCKIGIWGQFGDGGKIADGQAVRTTVITEELKKRYGTDSVCVVNTNNWRKRPLTFLWNTLKLNLACEKIVIFPADNGFKVCVPILNISNAFFRRELYYVVIGGFLPALLRRKKQYLQMLKKYRALFVQTQNIKRDLEEIGLNDVHILSNLKRLNTVLPDQVQVCQTEKIRVCTLSRITEDKGITYAVEAVKMANQVLGEGRICLDIYGICPPDYQGAFDALLKENREFVRYGGVVDFDKTTETLSSYFAMLLPTYYYGEGFPGCVVDAYNAALPIIATDWNYNADVIVEGENGFLVPIKDAKSISEALVKLYRNRQLAFDIAMRNLACAEEYKPDKVLEEFYEFMDK